MRTKFTAIMAEAMRRTGCPEEEIPEIIAHAIANGLQDFEVNLSAKAYEARVQEEVKSWEEFVAMTPAQKEMVRQHVDAHYKNQARRN